MAAEYSTQVETADPQISYLTTDSLGSPRVITDAEGNVTSRRDFMPFGEEIGAGAGGRTVMSYLQNSKVLLVKYLPGDLDLFFADTFFVHYIQGFLDFGIDTVGVETIFCEEQFRVTVGHDAIGDAHTDNLYLIR